MLELYFVYNGHCKFYLGTFDNVDELIEQMEDHQWAFSAITHPRFQKHIGQRTTRQAIHADHSWLRGVRSH